MNAPVVPARDPVLLDLVRPMAARTAVSRVAPALAAHRTFATWFLVYLAAAAVLVFGLGSVALDGWSRVANASYVLFSRDPHLGAIGFVWNPLPSLIVLPLLPLTALWPPLVTHGFAANLVSAAAMAAAVAQLAGFLAERRVARGPRLVILAAFAANPLILHYAANGMSEALFVLFLVAATRALVGWSERPHAALLLVPCGLALALAYLVRYEALAAAVAVGLLVAIVSAARAGGGSVRRLHVALADVIVVLAPVAFVFTAWAVASWLIVGSPFETFTSAYGNAAQMLAQGGPDAAARGFGYVARQIVGIAPALPIAAAVGLVIVVRRREPSFPAGLAAMSGALAFSAAAFLAGSSFGWLRFYIAAVPLAAMCAGLVLTRERVEEPTATARRAAADWLARLSTLASLAASRVARGSVLAALAVSIPLTGRTMLDAGLSRGDEAFQLQTLASSFGAPLPSLGWRSAGAEIAREIDAMGVGRGAVLVDAFAGFPIVVQSRAPDRFVITPDRDFGAVLADPATFHVQYVLVPEPVGNTRLDAIERSYPGAYVKGAGLGPLVREFSHPNFTWRLYGVSDTP